MDQERLKDLSDHDILLILSETVKNNHQVITNQIENVVDSVADIKSGVYKQLSDHEARLRVIEELHIKLDPMKIKEQVDADSKRLDFYADAYKIFFGVVVLLNVLYGLVITNIINLHRFFVGGK